jgi:aldehyde dehydrogenase (NAD+)
MNNTIIDFGIQKDLETLGIKPVNPGTSTGNQWFASGEEIASFSPVDGELIGKVKPRLKKTTKK